MKAYLEGEPVLPRRVSPYPTARTIAIGVRATAMRGNAKASSLAGRGARMNCQAGFTTASARGSTASIPATSANKCRPTRSSYPTVVQSFLSAHAE